MTPRAANPSRQIQNRVRDFALYIAISLAVGAVAILLGRSHLSLGAISQWFGLAFYSAVLYGIFISANWYARRQRHFWLVTILAFCVHAATFAAIIVNVPQWRPIWSAVMFLELPLLDRAKARFAPDRKYKHH
jgi:hypothetical protein